MSETKRGVILRLSAEGAETVKSALRSLGKDGEDALRKLERTSKTVAPHLRLIDTAALEAKRGVQSLAAEAGTAGRVLSSLGPGGIAAAAGIGVVALGIGAAVRIAKEANREFDELAKTVRDLSIDSDVFQGLRFAALQEGIANPQFDQAMKTAQQNFAQIELGVGRTIRQLQAYDGQLVAGLQNASTFEQRLRLVADAVARQDDAMRRQRMTALIFGEGNAEVSRILKDGSGAFDQYVAVAREYGVVVARDVLAKQEELNNKLGVAAHVVDVNLKKAFIDLVPVIVWAAERIAEVAQGISTLIDLSREIEDRVTVKPLQADLANTQNEIIRLKERRDALAREGTGAIGGLLFGDTKTQLAMFDKEIEAKTQLAMRMLDRLNVLMHGTAGPEPAPKPGPGNTPPPPRLGGDNEAERIETTIEALRHQADQLGRTGAEQAAYNALVQAGIDENHAMAPAVMGAARALYEKQAAAKAAAEALKENEERARSLRQSFTGLLRPFLSDLDQAKSKGEVLSNLLGRLKERALDVGLDLLANAFFPTGFAGRGGLFGGRIIPGILHRGGMPWEAQFAGSVPSFHSGRGPGEFFAKIKDTEGVFTQGQMKALGAGMSRRGAVDINVSVSGARGDREIQEMVAAGVAAGLEQYQAGESERVGNIVSVGYDTRPGTFRP